MRRESKRIARILSESAAQRNRTDLRVNNLIVAVVNA